MKETSTIEKKKKFSDSLFVRGAKIQDAITI